MTENRWPDDWAERMAGEDCPMCASLVKLNYLTLGNTVPHLHTQVEAQQKRHRKSGA
jgi:hypothetical protein